jgi:hypothetical protein
MPSEQLESESAYHWSAPTVLCTLFLLSTNCYWSRSVVIGRFEFEYHTNHTFASLYNEPFRGCLCAAMKFVPIAFSLQITLSLLLLKLFKRT